VHNPADLATLPSGVVSRAITFENPTGSRGAGGTSHGGRKGAPSRRLQPGERVVLAEIQGPGVIRHIWMTFTPAPPEQMRAQVLEVFYDGNTEPSISVPAVDFFGIPMGRPVPLSSALTSIQEGRGFNAHIPMPFHHSVRVEFANGGDQPTDFYYQLDYTLEALPESAALLHASFRRQDPTTMLDDFVISDGITGPGRFLGCVVGIRVLDGGIWYGEGEVKIFVDGDTIQPTICGTGLEDYVGSAWGMGPHQALFAGAPLDVRPPDRSMLINPDMVGFYRWHVADPIYFERELRVTIQQIGMNMFFAGQEDELAAARPAGSGYPPSTVPGLLAAGITERADDYCATDFVFAGTAQPVRRLQLDEATTHLARFDYEHPAHLEVLMAAALAG
jgi:hypothetical protein